MRHRDYCCKEGEIEKHTIKEQYAWWWWSPPKRSVTINQFFYLPLFTAVMEASDILYFCSWFKKKETPEASWSNIIYFYFYLFIFICESWTILVYQHLGSLLPTGFSVEDLEWSYDQFSDYFYHMSAVSQYNVRHPQRAESRTARLCFFFIHSARWQVGRFPHRRPQIAVHVHYITGLSGFLCFAYRIYFVVSDRLNDALPFDNKVPCQHHTINQVVREG